MWELFHSPARSLTDDEDMGDSVTDRVKGQGVVHAMPIAVKIRLSLFGLIAVKIRLSLFGLIAVKIRLSLLG